MTRYKLRPVLATERSLLYSWRNDPRARSVMPHAQAIDFEAHAYWWPAAIDDPVRRMLMLEDEGSAVAVIVFFNARPSASAQWGFYTAPGLESSTVRSLAAWMTIEVAAIAYAFDRLGVDLLTCETIETNAAVLLLHDRAGFETVGTKQVSGRPERFIEKSYTRAAYDRRRTGPVFRQLEAVAIEPDPRDTRGACFPASGAQGSAPSLAIVASANWALAARDLSDAFRTATHISLDQYAMAGADPAPDPPGVVIFAERFEDLASVKGETAGIDEHAARERLESYLETILSTRRTFPGLVLVNDFAPVRPYVRTIAEMLSADDAPNRLVRQFNARLRESLAGQPDLALVPLADLVAEVGRRNSDPGKYWLLGRLPFGQILIDRWTSCIAGMIAAREGQTVRAIVCDLDDTLWGGAVGETGLQGIALGGDHPGNAFAAVQKALKALSDRGVLLAICSKNEETVALDAIRRHPEMILREADFSARRIGWEPKAASIASIAAELGLSERSILVLENDPLERAELRVALPHAFTPELPWDVAEWPRFLANHPLLTQLDLLPEDVGRRNAYSVKRALDAAAGEERNRESILAGLDLRIQLKPVEDGTLQRALQLAAKTNQFNTTTIRYKEADLQRNSDDRMAWTVRLRDRLGGDAIVGLAVMSFDPTSALAEIENMLLSCRVLGKGIETAVLAFLSETALQRGCRGLKGRIVETERNHPCRELYASHGFEREAPGRFTRNLAYGAIAPPAWISLF